MAQQPAKDKPDEGRFYIGAGVTTIEYHIYYEDRKSTGSVRSGYFQPLSFTIGYNLTEGVRVRLCFTNAYAGM